jgi:hypothetical protein
MDLVGVAMKKYIPEGMLKATEQCLMNDSESARLELSTEEYKQIAHDALDAALDWFSENPMVPSSGILAEIAHSLPQEKAGTGCLFEHVITEWQRRMFVAHGLEVPIRKSAFIPADKVTELASDEPHIQFKIGRTDVPNEIKDLLWGDDEYESKDVQINKRLIEAYNRGRNNPRETELRGYREPLL